MVNDIAEPAARLASFRPPPDSGQRDLVVGRDGPWCRYCGHEVFRAKKGGTRLTIDHVTPISRGGSNWADNRVVACDTCNDKKGNRTLEEYGVALRPPQGPWAPPAEDEALDATG